MRACKNKTVDYLDGLEDERRDHVLKKAIRLGRMQRDRRRKTQKELRLELIRRQKNKEQKRNDTERKKVENFLKQHGLEATKKEYPSLDYAQLGRVTDILEGTAVGKHICHIWIVENEVVPYYGMIKKLYATKKYKISYWTEEQGQDNATDFQMSMYALYVPRPCVLRLDPDNWIYTDLFTLHFTSTEME